MDECKSCGNGMDRQGTHWEGCHANHPECAAFKAGREAGMREAAAVCKLMAEKYRSADMLDCSGYILSAIGGGK